MPITTDPAIHAKKIITPKSKKLYIDVCLRLKVVYGHAIQKGPEVCYFFSLLSRIGLDHFLDINEVINEEAVKLF